MFKISLKPQDLVKDLGEAVGHNGHGDKAVHFGPQPFSSWIVGQRNQGRLGRETEFFPGPATEKRASGAGEMAQWL